MQDCAPWVQNLSLVHFIFLRRTLLHLKGICFPPHAIKFSHSKLSLSISSIPLNIEPIIPIVVYNFFGILVIMHCFFPMFFSDAFLVQHDCSFLSMYHPFRIFILYSPVLAPLVFPCLIFNGAPGTLAPPGPLQIPPPTCSSSKGRAVWLELPSNMKRSSGSASFTSRL